VSYSKKGKLQVKMFGAGKKQYSLFTTDRATRQESINKSLPNEIKKALGESKAKIVEKMKKEEQKKLKQEELAARSEEIKNRFDSIMNERERIKEKLDREKNSDQPDERKIKKLQGRWNTLELERLKTKKTLDDSILDQKDVEALAEELAEDEENEEEVTKDADQLRTLRKHKENLIWRRDQELDYFLHDPNFATKLDPNLSPEEQLKQKINAARMREESKKRIKDLNNAIQEDDVQERALERVLGQKRAISDLKAEQLKASRKELTEKIQEAEKIANNEDADPEEKKIAQ